jgi:hypothetical protein
VLEANVPIHSEDPHTTSQNSPDSVVPRSAENPQKDKEREEERLRIEHLKALQTISVELGGKRVEIKLHPEADFLYTSRFSLLRRGEFTIPKVDTDTSPETAETVTVVIKFALNKDGTQQLATEKRSFESFNNTQASTPPNGDACIVKYWGAGNYEQLDYHFESNFIVLEHIQSPTLERSVISKEIVPPDPTDQVAVRSVAQLIVLIFDSLSPLGDRIYSDASMKQFFVDFDIELRKAKKVIAGDFGNVLDEGDSSLFGSFFLNLLKL